MRVSVYLGNDWELSHFNTLMFVAISVMWLQRMQRALQSTCDDDSQIVSQLVKLFVSVEYNSYEFFSWVTLQCLLTNWFNSQWKKFHHKNCIFIAAIFIFIPRWFPVSACSLPAQLLALYCSYHPLCSMGHVRTAGPCCMLLQAPGLCSASTRCVSRLWPQSCPGLRRTAGCSHREPGLQ